MPPPNYISAEEAAARLSVSKQTVIRLIQANEIAAEKKTTGLTSGYLVDADSVDAYRAKRQTPRA